MTTWNKPELSSLAWLEIPATNKAELKKFYQELFPEWTWRENDTDAHVARFNMSKTAFGGIVQMPESLKPQEQPMGIGYTPYFMVDNIDEFEKKVHRLGGATCLQKKPEGPAAWFINFRDIQGNRFGAYQYDG